MKIHLPALITLTLLSACGGGMTAAVPNPTPSPTPTPTPAPIPSPTTVQGSCTNNASSPSGVNTCFELERIGGLALSFTEVNSVAASSTYDRALTALMSGASVSCPVSGSLSASSPRTNEILLTYQACNFGLGAMSGSVLSRDSRSDAARMRGDPPNRADLTLDISTSRVRYQCEGNTLNDTTVAQISCNGSITASGLASQSLLTDFTASAVSGTPNTYRGTFSSQHGVSAGQNFGTLNSVSNNTEFEVTSTGSLFVRVSEPTFSSVRYTRQSTFSGSGQTATQGDLAINGASFTLPLRNSNTQGTETLESTFSNVTAQPRYEFNQ